MVLRLVAAAAAAAGALVLVLPAHADAPPVGRLPKGPVTTIATRPGSLVAVALPHRADGLVWRLSKGVDPKVLVEVSEADVGRDVVVVYRAVKAGHVKLAYGLTRGERAHARASLSFAVTVGG
ncbi:MAG TPA: hypothetical protein VHC67_09675 [Gaiellaceae bacterium]|jgi:hypothetical protein|nr:hypothetical protein [Gaiellaceae bacterium]